MGRSLAILAKKKADSLYIPEARSLHLSGGFSAVFQGSARPYMTTHQLVVTGMYCTTTCLDPAGIGRPRRFVLHQEGHAG